MTVTKAEYLSLRRRLAEKQGYRCYYCGCPVDWHWKLCDAEKGRSITLEHYVPRSAGGRDNEDDCVVSCRSCDLVKGSMHGDRYVALVREIRMCSVPDGYRRSLPFKPGPDT